MKLKIYSDITLNPLIKEIKCLSNELIVEFNYKEDLLSFLLSVNHNNIDTSEIIYIHFDNYFHRADDNKQINILKGLIEYSKRVSNKIIVSNSFVTQFTNTNQKNSLSRWFDFWTLEPKILNTILNSTNIYFFDFIKLIMKVGLEASYNFKLGHLYQMPYTKKLLNDWSKLLFEQVEFQLNPEKKVIVLDCDNTLWNGILGEEGIDGIICDLNHEGIIHHHFQQFLKLRKEDGFLLSLCSKNDEDNVKKVFLERRFPLKWEDFIVTKVNWEDKYKNIQSIADELNVGLDSLIFIDDSDFETKSVESILPEVSVLKFTNSYNDLVNLMGNKIFLKKLVLGSDKYKTEQYKAQKSRNEELRKYDDIETYIQSLNIKLDVRLNHQGHINRLSQLTEKTNQFNFNKHIYTPAELEELIDKGHRLYSLNVMDKYGDYGIVGLIIIKLYDDFAVVDNFILSCRALGRNIESKFYKYVIDEIENENYSIKEIKFKITERNLPAQKFYKKLK